MTKARHALRVIAVISNLAVAAYWMWGFIHVWSASQARFDSSQGFLYASWVLPGILAVAALVWIRHNAMRMLAVIANVLVAIWWVFYSAAMPTLSWFQLFWSSFAFTAAIAVVALLLDAKESGSNSLVNSHP